MIMMMVAVDVDDNDDDGNNDDDDFYILSLNLLYNIYLTVILRFSSTKKKRRKRKIKNQFNRRQVFGRVLFYMTAVMWHLISSKFDFLYRGIITESESWCWYLIWYLRCGVIVVDDDVDDDGCDVVVTVAIVEYALIFIFIYLASIYV